MAQNNARKAETVAIAAQERAMGETKRALRAEQIARDAQKKAELVQTQLDEARRVCKETIDRTGGQLTVEDIQDMDREFAVSQVRLRDIDEVFQ
jgi:hypothetical protein